MSVLLTDVGVCALTNKPLGTTNPYYMVLLGENMNLALPARSSMEPLNSLETVLFGSNCPIDTRQVQMNYLSNVLQFPADNLVDFINGSSGGSCVSYNIMRMFAKNAGDRLFGHDCFRSTIAHMIKDSQSKRTIELMHDVTLTVSLCPVMSGGRIKGFFKLTAENGSYEIHSKRFFVDGRNVDIEIPDMDFYYSMTKSLVNYYWEQKHHTSLKRSILLCVLDSDISATDVVLLSSEGYEKLSNSIIGEDGIRENISLKNLVRLTKSNLGDTESITMGHVGRMITSYRPLYDKADNYLDFFSSNVIFDMIARGYVIKNNLYEFERGLGISLRSFNSPYVSRMHEHLRNIIGTENETD